MNPKRILREKEIFLACRELPAVARLGYLHEQCGDDEDLRSSVERLLAQDAVEAGSTRGLPDLEALLHSVSEAAVVDAVEQAGFEFGDFRLLRELGHGGMGVVWLAEQKSLGRNVALKLIRPGLASASLLKRFRHEAAVLGQLSHPGIAHVYEVGTAVFGSVLVGAVERPYISMEYVPGVSLLVHAIDHGLDTGACLDLVTRVCDAVQHAHERGIVHRDLKPDNILIATDGNPKIVDFGIALSTGSEVIAMTAQTAVGQIIGTLQYMSPEQVLGDQERISFRSDVYSLGVVIFELLSGRMPIEVEGLSLAEAARRIVHDEPLRLRSVDPSIAVDVETVVHKALEKEVARRYESASELAADIRRVLHNEPIVARPTTTLYAVRKYARRNQGMVAGIGAALIILVIAIIVAVPLFSEVRRLDGVLQKDEVPGILDAAKTALTADDLVAAERRLVSVPFELRDARWRLLRCRLHAQAEVSRIPKWLALDAVTRRSGRHYFFRGPYFHKKMDDTPVAERTAWDGDGGWSDFPLKWGYNGVDAAVFSRHSTYYFYKDHEYASYNRGFGYVHTTAESGWPGMPWEGLIDAAAFNEKERAYYFIHDDHYTTKLFGKNHTCTHRTPIEYAEGFPRRRIKGAAFKAKESRLYLFYSDSYSWIDVASGDYAEEPIAYESPESEYPSSPSLPAFSANSAEPPAVTLRSLVPADVIASAVHVVKRRGELIVALAQTLADIAENSGQVATLSDRFSAAVEGDAESLRIAREATGVALSAEHLAQLQAADDESVFEAASIAVGGTVRSLPATLRGMIRWDTGKVRLDAELSGGLTIRDGSAERCAVGVWFKETSRWRGGYVAIAVPYELGGTAECRVYLSLRELETLGLAVVMCEKPSSVTVPIAVNAGYAWLIE